MDENGLYVPQDSYSATAVRAGAFRRDDDRSAWDHSLLDYAMASAQGTTTEFETMARLLRFVNQPHPLLLRSVAIGGGHGRDPGSARAGIHRADSR